MAETVSQGLRDLQNLMIDRLFLLRQARQEAERAAGREREAADPPIRFANWITGTDIVFLDFGRGGPFGGGRSSGSPSGGG